MRIKFLILLMLILIVLSSCTKNSAELTVVITADKLDILTGDTVTFTIDGKADFITYYRGLDSLSMYENYPLAKGIPITSPTTISLVYPKHNLVKTTFIVASYGNWGAEEMIQQLDYNINVRDIRTGISIFLIKKPGLWSTKYYGTMDAEKGAVSIKVNAGTDISAMQTTIITESSAAIVYLDGRVFNNLTKLDYSMGDIVFTVEAPDGTRKDWTASVSEE